MTSGIKKLKSNSGVTILFAMLLVLVAATVSCVILAAASTSAKTVASDREYQQNYLTVSSAAELVRAGLSKETYSVEEKTVTDVSGAEVTVTEADGLFADLINSAMDEVLDGQTYSTVFEISGNGLDTVLADFTMDGDANIYIVFSIDGVSGSKVGLRFDSRLKESAVTSSSGTGERKTVTEIHTFSYTWEAGDIGKVGE